MNNRSKRALSPVVAEIILIAVTVAVAIAVAAWMGALTFSFTSTEQGQITQLQFSTNPQSILVTFNNTGTSAITITQLWVNNAQISDSNIVTTYGPNIGSSVAANSGAQLNVTTSVTSGASYQVELLSSKGNKFTSTGTASS